jgi:hypothetical protein
VRSVDGLGALGLPAHPFFSAALDPRAGQVLMDFALDADVDSPAVADHCLVLA